jgi:hypothetical protein
MEYFQPVRQCGERIVVFGIHFMIVEAAYEVL